MRTTSGAAPKSYATRWPEGPEARLVEEDAVSNRLGMSEWRRTMNAIRNDLNWIWFMCWVILGLELTILGCIAVIFLQLGQR